MFKKILVGYDGSNGSHRALVQAVEMAKMCDAALIVLTVYRHHSMLEASLSMVRGSLEPGGNLDEAMRSTARNAADYAKSYAKDAGVAQVNAFIKAGPPARTKRRRARRLPSTSTTRSPRCWRRGAWSATAGRAPRGAWT